MGAKSNRKGGNLERLISVQLSKWWTDDQRDDIFWRTSGSGGRATNRGKAGKSTSNAHGDICFIDDYGKDLLRVLTFELKHGYDGANLQRFIDSKACAHTLFADWILQAKESANGANTPYWAIISKQDRRETLIHLPWSFYNDGYYVHETQLAPCIFTMTGKLKDGQEETVVSTPFVRWLKDSRTKPLIHYHITVLNTKSVTKGENNAGKAG
jgi:hypothetical protein